MKKTLGCLRRAAQDFKLLPDEDRIAVGVSGGKDSMLLLKALSLYRRFSKKHFSITAVNVGMGLGFDPAGIEAFCRELEVDFRYVDARLLEVVQSVTKTPDRPSCALCAKPVSYTHLDVYKRQDLVFAPTSAGWKVRS